LGTPSSQEYWHIGETKMRLGMVTERSVIGLKSRDMGWVRKVASEVFESSTATPGRSAPLC
jgi:hypothetical protein